MELDNCPLVSLKVPDLRSTAHCHGSRSSSVLAKRELATPDAKPLAGALRGRELRLDLEMNARTLLREANIVIRGLRNPGSSQDGASIRSNIALKRELRLPTRNRAPMSYQVAICDDGVISPGVATTAFLGGIAYLDDGPCTVERRTHCRHGVDQQCRKCNGRFSKHGAECTGTFKGFPNFSSTCGMYSDPRGNQTTHFGYQ